MKVDITQPEQMFSSLISGLDVFVMNQFQEYEMKLQVLVEEVKKLRAENEELKNKIPNDLIDEGKKNE